MACVGIVGAAAWALLAAGSNLHGPHANPAGIAGFGAAVLFWFVMLGPTGAWLFRVDVHTLAIASAANIGGAASAPVVAAHHRESLVPASILMALIGYALGNYLAILTGRLAQLVGG